MNGTETTTLRQTSSICPTCKSKLFDGEIIKGASIIRFGPASAQGKCKRCKTWVNLPIELINKPHDQNRKISNLPGYHT